MSETFGRYQLLRKIAVGGMGEVFLARQKGPVGFEKLLVVKRILPHLCEDDEFIEMFYDEARIAAALNHPNIAHIFDLGEFEGTHFIAMEYVHGECVATVNQSANEQKGGLPIALKCRIVADAAGGLDYAHQAKTPKGKSLNVIHRDVSPQNILVGYNGSVKLIDFGVAKAVGKVSTTRVGSVKGKYAYMSPEQARGEPLDHRSDVFGLGIVFYELLANQRLFKRASQTDSMHAVLSGDIQPPSKLVKTIPRTLEAIVMKALERKVENRFESAKEMQLAIEEFLTRQRLPSTNAHLSAFMTELFPKGNEPQFPDEPTEVTLVRSRTSPSSPSQPSRPPSEDLSSQETIPEAHRKAKQPSTDSGSGKKTPSR